MECVGLAGLIPSTSRSLPTNVSKKGQFSIAVALPAQSKRPLKLNSFTRASRMSKKNTRIACAGHATAMELELF